MHDMMVAPELARGGWARLVQPTRGFLAGRVYRVEDAWFSWVAHPGLPVVALRDDAGVLRVVPVACCEAARLPVGEVA